MQRLVLFILVLVVIYYVRRWLQRGGRSTAAEQIPAQPAEAELMCECAQCGLLVPESEAVRSGERFFCSPEHARQAGSGHQD